MYVNNTCLNSNNEFIFSASGSVPNPWGVCALEDEGPYACVYCLCLPRFTMQCCCTPSGLSSAKVPPTAGICIQSASSAMLFQGSEVSETTLSYIHVESEGS